MKMKKLLALLLGATMLLSSATAINASAVTTDKPAAAVSHDARGASGTTSTGLLWDLTDGVLTISTNGTDTAMGSYEWPNNSADWCAHKDTITSVVIEDGVTSIGVNAFRYCTNLTSVTIGNSVTSIGHAAFDVCSSLTAINVDNENQTYSSEDGVLFNKEKTELIDCPEGKEGAYAIPDSVTSIERYAFSYCERLTSVTIPDSVTSIGINAFRGCTSLTSIIIPDSVTSIGHSAFYDTPWLANQTEEFVIVGNGVLLKYNGTSSSVTIPDSVTSIGDGVFTDCSNLTSVTIPNSVKSLGDQVFSFCSNLREVIFEEGSVLESIGTEDQVESYSACFAYCESLETIVFPESLKYLGSWTFDSCLSLTSLYFEGNMPDNIENAYLGEEGSTMAFAQIYVLNGGAVDLSEENPVPQKDGYVFNCYSESNSSIIAPDYTKYDRDYLDCYWDDDAYQWKSNEVDLQYTWDDFGCYYYYIDDDSGDEVRLDQTYVLYAHYNEVTEEEVSADDRVVDSTQTSTLVGLETLGLQIRNVEKQGYEEQPRGYISTSDSGEATRFVGALTDETITNLVSGGCEILEYGFVVAKKNSVSANSLTVDDPNATVVNCASSYAFSDGTVVSNPGADIDKDRSNTDTYRIFSLVIEYEGASEELKAEEIVGRAYLKYVDGNGRTSVIYGRYGGTVVKGGCSASYNQVAEAAWNEILRH